MGDNGDNWQTHSFDVPPELAEQVEGYLDESLLFDTRSQFYRAAIRTYMAEESDEFSEAR